MRVKIFLRNTFILAIMIAVSFLSFAQTPVYKGLYVDNFASIIGSIQAEDSLLNYAKQNQFNTLSLYDLHIVHQAHDLTQLATSSVLSNFISKARQQYHISHITAIGENFNFFRDVIYKYNQLHLPSEKFDVYNLEFEFWNLSSTGPSGVYCVDYLIPNNLPCTAQGAYTFFLQQLTRLDSLAHADGCLMETYVGWPDSLQAVNMLPYADRILVHAYVANPSLSYNYTKQRLKYYGSTLMTEKLIIIFSSENIFLGPWLVNDPEKDAYNIWKAGYDSELPANWKNHTNMLGYQWFDYGNIPYIVNSNSISISQASNKLKFFQSERNIFCKNQSLGDINIAIFAVDGRKILETKLSSKKTNLSVPDFFTDGVYLLHYWSDAENGVQKIYLQN